MTRDPGQTDALTTIHVRQARKGDPESTSWIVERFTPLLLAQARYRVRGRYESVIDPEDVVNDVWLRCIPKLEDVQEARQRETPRLLAFLSTALLNRINTLIMKHVRRGEMPGGSIADEVLAQVPQSTIGVVTRAVRAERYQDVLGAIAELPDDDREVVVLRAIEQHTNAQVGTMLGMEPGTVAVRYHRALARLKKRLPDSAFAGLDPD